MHLTGGPDDRSRGNPASEQEPDVNVGQQQAEAELREAAAELREVDQGRPWTSSNLIDISNFIKPLLSMKY